MPWYWCGLSTQGLEWKGCGRKCYFCPGSAPRSVDSLASSCHTSHLTTVGVQAAGSRGVNRCGLLFLIRQEPVSDVCAPGEAPSAELAAASDGHTHPPPFLTRRFPIPEVVASWQHQHKPLTFSTSVSPAKGWVSSQLFSPGCFLLPPSPRAGRAFTMQLTDGARYLILP